MTNYNFHDLLEPMEFQDLVRDIVQVRDNIFLESFKEGADQGIDGLLYDKHRKIVLQVKRYNLSYSKLLYILKTEELPKVRKLRPTRYILGISMDFLYSQKEEIRELFEGYIEDTNDIISAKDMNNLLGIPKYKFIEKNYTKLWLPSIEIMSDLLEQSVHKGRIRESEYELKMALRTAKFYVQTKMYKRALKKLEKNNVVIISGEPGMGKTAMAYMLAISFLQMDATSGFVWVNSIDDVYASIKDEEAKQAFILDDFWGSVLYDGARNNEERRLEKLILRISKMKNKKMILTSREYILQQGLYKSLTLNKLIDNLKLQCTLEEYSDSEKAKILFHHLKASDLEIDYIKAIYFRCDKIVYHQSYNPRVIDLFLSNSDEREVSSYDYAESLIYYLDYPYEFWRDIFLNLSEEAKILAMIMMISYTPIRIDDLKLSYSKYLLNHSMNLNLKNFNDCISELEQTVIKTYWDEDEQDIRVEFRNPSIGDFLYEYIGNNLEQYVLRLLKISAFYNQVLYIFEHFCENACSEITILVEEKCINDFNTLPMRIADYGDLDGDFEIYHDDEDHALNRVFHLIRLCDRHKNIVLYNFLQEYIHDYCKSMGRNEFYANYFELLEFPRVIKRFCLKGMKFDGSSIIENYYRSIYNIEHYMAMDEFEEVFKDEYSIFKEKNQSEIKNNIKTIILESLDYFDIEDMFVQMDMLIDSIPDILKKYGLRYTKGFKKDIFNIAGRVYEPENKKTLSDRSDIEIEEAENEIDYKQVIYESYEWLFGNEMYSLNDDEILSRVHESNLSDKIKLELKTIIKDRRPWYIYEYLSIESSLEKFILLWTEEGLDFIPHDINIFFYSILYTMVKKDSGIAKKLVGFCAEFYFNIFHQDEAIISEKSFRESNLYSFYIKDDEAFENFIFQTILRKSENWIIVENELLMIYCFVKVVSSDSEDNYYYSTLFSGNFDKVQIKSLHSGIYDTSYGYFEYMGYTFRNHKLERIIFRLFEEIDTFNFNYKHVYVVFSEFLDTLNMTNNDSKVLSLLEKIELSVEILPSGEIDSTNMVICDALSAAEYLDIGDIIDMWLIELTEEQINLLWKRKNICKKNGDKYIVEVYKERDISILKQLKLYGVVLELLKQIEKIHLKFLEGDYSNILYDKD
ncbi:RNA helicase domain-containing protein [Irregularibacter muris]|uniref:RNA helicase domain-containing protein n=1 Tax=Irregularibacter muris TaxID=1796619 RepID=A0AAE3HK05_9FIRM|nr:RNA helicase domain-containing protein [Irregularibacter muris]MCR1900143.1 RNA helicase domain-containing protein [Irregularibacter muris]